MTGHIWVSPMNRLLLGALLFLGVGVLSARYLDQKGGVPVNAAPVQAVSPSSNTSSSNTRSLVVHASGGHFAVDARVDGRRIPFMIDTGASHITIRESDAWRLGFHPKERDYTIRMNTANGVGRAAQVDLRMVEVGDILVRDVPALVVPDNVLSVNLLGMTLLSRVRWSHDRGRLMLEQ
jgi:aspartyl protease family protein